EGDRQQRPGEPARGSTRTAAAQREPAPDQPEGGQTATEKEPRDLAKGHGLLPSAEPSSPSSHTAAGAPARRQAAGVVFSGKWHATWWPGASSSRGGGTVRHTSCAFQHRVWNRQAGGGLSGLGTSPVRRTRSRR